MGLSVELQALLTAAADGRLAVLIDALRAGSVRKFRGAGIELDLGPELPGDDAADERPQGRGWTRDEMFGHSEYEPAEQG